MRLGLFTDTYHPALNGIVYVVDIMRRQLEAEGHEVYVFCPEIYIGKNGDRRTDRETDPKVIRFPAIESGFFDDFGISVFFPKANEKENWPSAEATATSSTSAGGGSHRVTRGP
jgi:1,2-diacylglycerol 3-alpha-glucosyltransferase